MVCLDPDTCIVGKRSIQEENKKVQPRTAVCFGKIRDRQNSHVLEKVHQLL